MPEPLQCMEIWGGNRGIDSGVSLAGMDCWVYARPFRGQASSPNARAQSTESVSGSMPEAEVAGGDIHFVTSCATGRITRFLVADVSGHGAPVAEMASTLRGLMRKHSNFADQRSFVESVNRRFSQLSDAAAGTSAIFATGVFGSYFAPTDELSVCNAGHPRPIWYDESTQRWAMIVTPDAPAPRRGKKGVESAAPSNLPLGVLDDTRYDHRVVKLGGGDLVLFYTDSLMEACAPDGRMLGENGLVEILNAMDVGEPASLLPRLIERVVAYSCGRCSASDGAGVTRTDNHEFNDDVTAMLVCRNPLKPKPSPLLGVRGAITLAKGFFQSLRPGGLPVSLPEFGFGALLGSVFPGMNRK